MSYQISMLIYHLKLGEENQKLVLKMFKVVPNSSRPVVLKDRVRFGLSLSLRLKNRLRN